MSDTLLDRLLTTLDIDVEAFAVCEVSQGRKLVARGVPEIEIHYVLAGTMYLAVPGRAIVECPTGSVIIVPPRTPQTIGADPADGVELLAIDHARRLDSGLEEFDVSGGAPSDLRFVCGLVHANLSGAFGLLDAIRVPIVENLPADDGIRSCFRMMAAERDRRGVGSRALMGSLMKTCLLMAIRCHLNRGIHESSLLPALR
ncbi:MAG: cupin domain-containing protein, partial [Sphingomonas sp.]